MTSLGLEGPPSPPLLYSPEQGFCGDGIVDHSIGEECDDGNVRDADGCNMQCKKEDVFHCVGEWSDQHIISLYSINLFSSSKGKRITKMISCLDEATNSHDFQKRNVVTYYKNLW